MAIYLCGASVNGKNAGHNTVEDAQGCAVLQLKMIHSGVRPYDAAIAVHPTMARPKIVCLCGSTRFYRQFMEANYRETMLGNIVLSVGFFVHTTNCPACGLDTNAGVERLSKCPRCGHDLGCTDDQKVALDELHKKKIDIADEVLVLNVGKYIGESTQSEINHAIAKGKIVRYLEAV